VEESATTINALFFWKKRSVPGYRASQCRRGLHHRGRSALSKGAEMAADSIDGGKAVQPLEKLIARGKA